MLVALLLTLVPVALAQNFPSSPQVPEDAFTTRQLIAWSGLQKPQPTPQPLPPRDTPIPQPDQPLDQQASPPVDPNRDHTPAKSCTGTILKDGGKYVLRVGSKTFQLSEQVGLQKYEDQSVRVIGALDLSSDTIRVARIDLIL